MSPPRKIDVRDWCDEVRRALGLPRKQTSRSPRVRAQMKAATLPLFDGGER